MNYTDRVNRLARLKTTTERQEAAWVELMAMLAATLTAAGDAGHVSRDVHRKIEEVITQAETKMRLPL